MPVAEAEAWLHEHEALPTREVAPQREVPLPTPRAPMEEDDGRQLLASRVRRRADKQAPPVGIEQRVVHRGAERAHAGVTHELRNQGL
jgi:hypothetical protein